MNDDDRTARALRTALDDRATLVEPSDRLDEILRRTRPPGVVRPLRPARSTRSWLPLAAAAAVLAVVAGVWFGLPDRRDPLPGGTGTPAPSASPSVSTSTDPSPGPSPSPSATGSLAALPVYYLAPVGDDGRVARLYREWLTATGVSKDATEQVRARAAVGLAMTAVPAGTDGYLRTWEGVSLEDVAVTTGGITITLSGPGTTAFPADTERVSVQQLVWTAQAAVGRGTLPVRFVLADGSTRIFGTLPVDRAYNRPASRDLYYEDLAPIWVTSPTRGQVLRAGPVTVEGEASVFEATVSWQLLRDGAVVDEGHVMASIGAPGRGTYAVPLGTLAPGSYAVRVYEVSAQDGTTVSAETTMPFTVR
ncbi:Gmad2 immunoglobulin-like domain-containing protein [Oryzobacter telluris]|uniref:Gmad2 immunoglobulin-like domain-containing protein n=1 Tax=Oryzobacter telluris TaxID=3149179 RepID=UPI00370D440B